MYTLILITSLVSKFHHDLFINPPIPGFSTSELCKAAGEDILKAYISYDTDIKATIKCVKVQ